MNKTEILRIFQFSVVDFYQHPIVETILCMIPMFLNLWSLNMCPNIWSVLDNVPFALEKNVCAVVGQCSLYVR